PLPRERANYPGTSYPRVDRGGRVISLPAAFRLRPRFSDDFALLGPARDTQTSTRCTPGPSVTIWVAVGPQCYAPRTSASCRERPPAGSQAREGASLLAAS